MKKIMQIHFVIMAVLIILFVVINRLLANSDSFIYTVGVVPFELTVIAMYIVVIYVFIKSFSAYIFNNTNKNKLSLLVSFINSIGFSVLVIYTILSITQVI